MGESSIIIMLKDIKSNLFEKELGTYEVGENEKYIIGAYAAVEEDITKVFMKISCERDVLEWEFSAIYDYYDTCIFEGLALQICELPEEYNPTWEVALPFLTNINLMEEKINRVLEVHKAELLSVYEAIAENEDEYI